jgi:hypothetical protein
VSEYIIAKSVVGQPEGGFDRLYSGPPSSSGSCRERDRFRRECSRECRLRFRSCCGLPGPLFRPLFLWDLGDRMIRYIHCQWELSVVYFALLGEVGSPSVTPIPLIRFAGSGQEAHQADVVVMAAVVMSMDDSVGNLRRRLGHSMAGLVALETSSR